MGFKKHNFFKLLNMSKRIKLEELHKSASKNTPFKPPTKTTTTTTPSESDKHTIPILCYKCQGLITGDHTETLSMVAIVKQLGVIQELLEDVLCPSTEEHSEEG